MSAEILATGEQISNIREYSPKLDEVGYGTSSLQEMPYLINDKWGEHFRSEGFNPELKVAWKNRERNPKGWGKMLGQVFEKPLLKTLKEYEKQGVPQEEGKFHTMQLDADFLEEVFKFQNSEYSQQFLNTFYSVIGEARANNMVVNIFVNQYAGIRKGEEEGTKGRFQTLNYHLHELLHQNGLNGNDTDVLVQSIPERGKEFWLDYVDKIAELGGNAFRFSSEWSKVMNSDGSVNEQELDELAEIVQYARGRGIEVSMCLNHFTMPDWIEDGWLDPQIAQKFADYAEVVYNGLEGRDSLPKRFLTINEAMSVLSAGYLEGSWYPYEKLGLKGTVKQYSRYSEAILNSRNAHIESYKRLCERRSKTGKFVEVGFTHNMAWFSPYSRISPFDRIWSMIGKNLSESWMGDLIGKDALRLGYFPTDFIGIQFYNEHTIGPFNGTAGSKPSVRDLIDDANRFVNGWKRYPEGLLVQLTRTNSMVLKTATKLGTPSLPNIMISEFGVPGLVDPRDEIKVLSSAIDKAKELSNLEFNSAIIWTLHNNFELGEGYSSVQFGHLNYDGKEKQRGSRVPSELNLKDPNIRYSVKQYWEDLFKYVERVRTNELIPIREKERILPYLAKKLSAVRVFFDSLNN